MHVRPHPAALTHCGTARGRRAERARACASRHSYFLGVEDNGEHSGDARVSAADVEHSDAILRAMAERLRIDVLFSVALAPRVRCYALVDHRRQHMPDYELYPTGDAEWAMPPSGTSASESTL